MIKPMRATSVVLLGILSTSFASAPAWWQFGEFLKKQERNGTLRSELGPIPCESFDLSRLQLEECADGVDSFPNRSLAISLGLSVNLAAKACRKAFAKRQWNCAYSGGRDVFGSIVHRQTKESAVAYAMISAMAMYAIIRDCATGRLSGLSDKCGPGDSKNVEFAYNITKKFIDDPLYLSLLQNKDGQSNKATLIHLHNYEVGRLLVVKFSRCRCIGRNGTCSNPKCTKKMKGWEKIAASLKEAYDSAVKVKALSANKSRRHKESLVYVKPSPDFCRRSTKGRRCYAQEGRIGSCSVLCCGRGYASVTRTSTIKCNPRLIRYPAPIRVVYDECKGTVPTGKYVCN